MYDFPELREAHDAFWSALAGRLTASGLRGVPLRLDRELSHKQSWSHPHLLFSQGCEYPLSKSFADRVRIVATPCYGAPGCKGATYRSAIVVRRDSAATLADLRGRRCVVNEMDSNSGMNLLRAFIARTVSSPARFFGSVRVSGSHLRSACMVAAGEADVAAIDCVSFAHFGRLYPSAVSGLRVLDWTPESPSLPFITAHSAPEEVVQALRAALAEVLADAALAEVREKLLLQGAELNPVAGFARVLELEREAQERGFPAIDAVRP